MAGRGQCQSVPSGVPHRYLEKMFRAGSLLFLALLSLAASQTTAALTLGINRNHTENSTAADGGFVPVHLTKVSQIIAREGSCVLIDCNVTGDPIPSVQWFNSHGERLDTETNGETALSL